MAGSTRLPRAPAPMLEEIPNLTATERQMLERFRDDESPDPVITRRVLQGVRAKLGDEVPAQQPSAPWWLWLRAGGLSVAIAASALLVLGGTARVVSRIKTPAPMEAIDAAPATDAKSAAKTASDTPSPAHRVATPPVPAPIETPIEIVEAPVVPLAVDPSSVDATRPRAKPSARDAAPAPASTPTDAAAEIALFKAIKVERDAKARLSAIARYHRDFAKGAFVQEVAVLEIGALCDLGRTADADKRSAAFAQAFGDSAFSGIAKRGCSEGGK